jgi:hypothetical protein
MAETFFVVYKSQSGKQTIGKGVSAQQRLGLMWETMHLPLVIAMVAITYSKKRGGGYMWFCK